MIVHDSRNRPVTLGRKIGGGGEGDVYAVTGRAELVAKIYAKPTREAADKLARMIDHPPSGRRDAGGHVNLAWPSELLYGAGHRAAPVGFLMPRVTGAVPLLEVFNPRLRARTLPGFDRRYLFRTARNLAAVLATLHQAGYVVGDVNESNILVTPSALVTFIDCDSFQVQAPREGRVVTYPCPVGKLEYTAPELQGKVFSREVRRPEADRFALGVLIFQLLMEGRHPFAGTWTGSGEPPSVEEKIRRGCFPYADRPTFPIAPPPNAPALATLPPAVGDLVHRCFIDGHRQPSRRPAPETWRDTLADAERAIRAAPAPPARAVERPVGQPSAAEGAPRTATQPRRNAPATPRRPRTPRATVASNPPRWRGARDAFGMLVAIVAIVGAVAGGSWWLLQRDDLPLAGAPGTTSDGGAPLAATTTPRPAAANVGAPNVCTPATEAAAAARADSVPRSAATPLAGSWVASAPTLRVRFFGMPWWDERPDLSRGARYAVGTVPGAGDFDRLDVVRAPGTAGSATAAAWQAELDVYTHRSPAASGGSLNPATITGVAVTGRARPQKAAGYDGYIGQFHFTEDGARHVDATLWVGQVGCDRVVLLFAGLPTRDRQIDQAVAQVLATIDFNAR